MQNSFSAHTVFSVGDDRFQIYRLNALKEAGFDISRLPYCIKILLENLLRREDGVTVTPDDIEALANWQPKNFKTRQIAFSPARTVLQDFSGIPALVDLASMREAMAKSGMEPARINPLQPVELVIDHSIQVDEFGSAHSQENNSHFDYQRNTERYSFLRWAQAAFKNLKIVPPNQGIVHQINLEYLSRVVFTTDENPKSSELKDLPFAYPDSCVGTDSHTPMVNGLGILAWGVGGIEAEATMLGQPISMLIPEVIGFKLDGHLPEGATATDLVLTITELLRKKGVVGKFVEFFGCGVSSLSIADRATIGNMSPEYGATCAIFPPDEIALQYLRFTGRPEKLIKLVEAYTKEQGLFHARDAVEADYSDIVTLNLSSVVPSVAGPKRPQDRIALPEIKTAFTKALSELKTSSLSESKTNSGLNDGSIVIAAITSCTNTSNPSVMVAAGLLAKRAVERGLVKKPWVKTSLAPGSQTVTKYLAQAGLLPYLEKLGFNVVGYGCTTCIGNSGPLPREVSDQIAEKDLVAVSVLSGNRNFEGRIHAEVQANFLMSPPLVVAFSLVGHIAWDSLQEPIGQAGNGTPIFLRDIWPSQNEINETMAAALQSEMFRETYKNIFEGDQRWKNLPVPTGSLYAWDESSSYIQNPPYFDSISQDNKTETKDIFGARVLVSLGDSVTTDHISPAGSINKQSPAGKYLSGLGIEEKDYNTYGSHRGNHDIMVRGTFASVRLKNLLVPGKAGAFNRESPQADTTSIYEASAAYQKAGTPLCILAGKDYGTGSSRDWAAKGPRLLGIKFVIAESFERIHRSNLVGMGILPLQFMKNENRESLGLTGFEKFNVVGLHQVLESNFAGVPEVDVEVLENEKIVKKFRALIRIDTPQEVLYYLHGGILNYVMRQMLAGKASADVISAGLSTAPQKNQADLNHVDADAKVQQSSEESFPGSDSPTY